jgi:protease II
MNQTQTGRWERCVQSIGPNGGQLFREIRNEVFEDRQFVFHVELVPVVDILATIIDDSSANPVPLTDGSWWRFVPDP